MSTWTTSALERLEHYLKGSRQRASASGADADEVAEDLRRHFQQEVAQLKLPVVTEEDVQRIIARTGVLAEEPAANGSPATGPTLAHRIVRPAGTASLLVFGVLLPITTLIIELVTHICAGSFFDPLPTWLHVLLVATVPFANVVAWRILRSPRESVPRWLWWTNGMAAGVGLFYAALFLPMAPPALIGILFFGFGLLPLTPLISLISTLRLRSHLRRRVSERGQDIPRGWWWAGTLPLVLLVLFALPAPLTRHWMDQAESDSPVESQRAIRLLRNWGDEDVILKECYGRSDRLSMQLFDERRANPDVAQKVYYRVTGKAFNSVPPPLSKYQKSAKSLFNEFEWDNALGGTAVAGQVRGLSLAQSRFDGISQPDEGWAYLQWTMEFRNDHEWNQREARAQIQLPPGAVVSRVTLWVNGEPREAAFAGRGEVREAYQKVAVQQRRDPVLVTMSGPDRVLVQCFPVPAKGGLMKIRLGITAPLLMDGTNAGLLRLPCVTERNFKVRSGFEHSFWLETPQKAQANFAQLKVEIDAKGKTGIRGQMADRELNADDAVLRFEISPARLTSLRATDPKTTGRVIQQTLEPASAKMPRRIAMVLDGSADMNRAFAEIARALDGIPGTEELTIWLAQEDVQQIFSSGWQGYRTASASVGRLRGAGGQDNVPALLQAWEWAAAKPESVVLWIHGAQPVLLSGVETLKQRLEWRSGADAPVVFDIPIEAGPNLIAEQLQSVNAFTALPRTGRLGADLERLFATWTGRSVQFEFKRVVDSAADKTTATASAHVVRLWAAEQINTLAKARRIVEAVNLAGEQQLVTTVSGAVVLETKQQFTDAGLTPADPVSVPVVPEPSTWALLALGLAMFLWINKTRRRQAVR